jgi:hypothetical protein
MKNKLMILPAHDYKSVRLIKIPEDFEEHEVFRYVTGIIAQVEENDPDYTWTDVLAALEDRGFENVEFILGPALD